jgi:hypothetical protein
MGAGKIIQQSPRVGKMRGGTGRGEAFAKSQLRFNHGWHNQTTFQENKIERMLRPYFAIPF